MSLLGGFYAAIDLTAGEKERGTMQTLLCAPVRPTEIIVGKFLAVWLLSIAAAGQRRQPVADAGAAPAGDDAPASAPPTYCLAFVLLVPVTLTTTAIFLAIAVFARDFKDGQNFLTPVYMAVALPAAV